MPALQPKKLEIGAQSPNKHEHGQPSQPLPTLDSMVIEQDPWIRIANIHTKRDTATPNTLGPDHKSIEVFGMVGMVVGIVCAVAGILALFKGWKFWKRKSGHTNPNGQHPWRPDGYGTIGNSPVFYHNTTIMIQIHNPQHHP